MSRQSKAAKRKIIAQGFTKMHQAGEKGPSQTRAIHGKVHTDRAAREAKRQAEARAAEAQAEQAKKSAPKAGKGGSKYAQKKAA